MPKIVYVGVFLPFLDPLHTIKTFSARFSCKNFPQDFPARFFHKIFLKDFPARISCKIFPQDFPTRISHKIFPQDFAARIFHKVSWKNFQQDFSELDPDWLAPHHPIPNTKFPPITALLNMPTYHKSAKVSPPPFPQISWEPQIN